MAQARRVPFRRWGRRVAFLAAVLSTSGCWGQLPSGASPRDTDHVNREAAELDYLYVAVMEIQDRCPDFGSFLFYRYTSGKLTWGSVELYGEADQGYDGNIRMDMPSYDMSNIEMLIADIYHEVGHAFRNEPESGYSPPWPDPWNRTGLDYTSTDDDYHNGVCPTGQWDQQ